MQLAFALLVLALSCAVPAWAGSFTVTTTPEQDAALALHLARPTIFTMKGQTTRTPQQYVEDLVRANLNRIAEHEEDQKVREQIRAGKKK